MQFPFVNRKFNWSQLLCTLRYLVAFRCECVYVIKCWIAAAKWEPFTSKWTNLTQARVVFLIWHTNDSRILSIFGCDYVQPKKKQLQTKYFDQFEGIFLNRGRKKSGPNSRQSKVVKIHVLFAVHFIAHWLDTIFFLPFYESIVCDERLKTDTTNKQEKNSEQIQKYFDAMVRVKETINRMRWRPKSAKPISRWNL